MKHLLILGFLGAIFLTPVAHGGEVLYQSGDAKVSLIELYSSEGCSSCPPADRRMASFKSHQDLFKKFVPINFHVDYWNYLGWVDRFSNKHFANRQRNYASQWKSSRVYTPAFVRDGEEWRGRNLSTINKQMVGNLVVEKSSKNNVDVKFTSKIKEEVSNLVVNVALLGNGLQTEVRAGENAGETLNHEFVVLKMSSHSMKKVGATHTVSLPLPQSSTKAPSYALAFWVSRQDSQTPLQAAGGFHLQP